MRRVKSGDTDPELVLRRRLWSEGARYRLKTRLPGKPDLAFLRERVAVFVDGDFWHGRQWRLRGFNSLADQMQRVNNPCYWIPKLSRTIERDDRVTKDLEADGWTVIRIWEADLKADPETHVNRVLSAIDRGPK